MFAQTVYLHWPKHPSKGIMLNLPKYALANKLYLGKDLTWIEEQVCTLYTVGHSEDHVIAA